MTEPKRYRKKPVVIEAMLYDGLNKRQIKVWSELKVLPEIGGKTLIVATKEGHMIANPGDYIIKGIKGEFYPCKPDIFKATYEEVSDE